jgi:hypothetical protein
MNNIINKFRYLGGGGGGDWLFGCNPSLKHRGFWLASQSAMYCACCEKGWMTECAIINKVSFVAAPSGWLVSCYQSINEQSMWSRQARRMNIDSARSSM